MLKMSVLNLMMLCAVMSRDFQVIKVSKSDYYAWRKRYPSMRELGNQELLEKILMIHKESNRAYGSVKITRLQEAGKRGIRVIVEISVPEQLSVRTFDMTVILGNLLDNAIHACSKLPEDKREIKIVIRYDKGRLIIDIKNQYDNAIRYDRGNIITTHEDRKNHGIGLSNVKQAVEKYQGLLDIEHSDDIFSITALLFVS